MMQQGKAREAAMKGRGTTHIRLDEGQTLTLTREDFDAGREVRPEDYGDGQDGDDGFWGRRAAGRRSVHLLVVHGPRGARVVVRPCTARRGDALVVDGALTLECADAAPKVVIGGHVHAQVDAACDFTAFGESLSVFDLRGATADCRILAANRARAVFMGAPGPVRPRNRGLLPEGDPCSGTGLLQDVVRDPRRDGVHPSVTAAEDAVAVGVDAPCITLEGRARGAAFGDTGMILYEDARADLYDRSVAYLHNRARASVMDDVQVWALGCAEVVPGEDPLLREPAAGYGSIPAWLCIGGDHRQADPGNVRLWEDAFDPTGTFAGVRSRREDAAGRQDTEKKAPA